MNEKVNYDTRMLELIAGMQSLGRRPSLLLHACCAPCSSAVLERLAQDFDILLFFDNPNLDTLQEHDARAAETVRLLSKMLPCAQVIVSPYEPAVFLEAVRGLEHLPEGGARCEACFRLRLSRSASKAAQMGCDWFTTTLTISPRKDAATLNRLGLAAGEAAGVRFLPSDFKKRGGYHRAVELSHEYSLYRQDYCGCAFSRRHSD